jgi:hypothetical protein
MIRYIDGTSERLDKAVEYPMYRGQKHGICGEKMAEQAYYCTRPRNHDGVHVAHSAPDCAIVMWTAKRV